MIDEFPGNWNSTRLGAAVTAQQIFSFVSGNWCVIFSDFILEACFGIRSWSRYSEAGVWGCPNGGCVWEVSLFAEMVLVRRQAWQSERAVSESIGVQDTVMSMSPALGLWLV